MPSAGDLLRLQGQSYLIEAIEWPDSALGCPQPDMVYAAVITPGYQVTITAQGTTYLVHTDSLSEGEKIICTQ